MSEEGSDCASQEARLLATVPEVTEGEDESKECRDLDFCEDTVNRGKAGVLRRSRRPESPPEPTTSAEPQSAPVTATTTHVTFANNSGQAQLFVPLSILVLVLGVLSAAFLKVYLEPPSAYEELRSYTISQSEGMKVESIAELPVDDLNSFAQSACVEARRADDIRTALKANLRVPPEVRDMIISSAVVDGVSTSSTMSNTTSDLASEDTFMKRSALDSARGILDAKASRSLFGAKRVEGPQLSWEAPDSNVFRGADRPSLSDESVQAVENSETVESDRE